METSKQFFIDNDVTPKDVITLENVTRYCKKADSTVLEFIELYNKSKKLFFKNGWVLYLDTVKNGDRIFYVTSMYVKQSNIDALAGLIRLVKHAGYDKIEFKTRRNAKAWQKKISKYIPQEQYINITGTVSCDLKGA